MPPLDSTDLLLQLDTCYARSTTPGETVHNIASTITPQEIGMIQVTTRVEHPTPTTTSVEGAFEYQAEIWLRDEAGLDVRCHGKLTYVGSLPFGDAIDQWISSDLMDALATPWVAAHERLVNRIIKSLADGPGVETFEVEL